MKSHQTPCTKCGGPRSRVSKTGLCWTCRVEPKPEKKCTQCQIIKPVAEFGIRYNKKTPRPRPTCRKCDYKIYRNTPNRNAAQKKWNTENPVKVWKQQRRTWLRRIGLIDSVDRILADYENIKVCQICGEQNKNGRRLAVDHCHEKMIYRGLLCENCNRGLGLFKDDPIKLEAAIRYLTKG